MNPEIKIIIVFIEKKLVFNNALIGNCIELDIDELFQNDFEYTEFCNNYSFGLDWFKKFNVIDIEWWTKNTYKVITANIELKSQK